jgi:hypothetical protein
MANLTYLLGAGASKNAMPIQKELYENMILMANELLNNGEYSELKNPYEVGKDKHLLYDIGYFGLKAKQFGTIDTYARRLFLLKNDSELGRLQLAVNNFFTLWQLSNDIPFKAFKKYPDVIDKRYISLLSTILDPDQNDGVPKIKPNVNFVTWNYDLQLEMAFKLFCQENADWATVKDAVKFSYLLENDNYQICHMNGYHGFYYYDGLERNLIERNEGRKPFREVLENIAFTTLGQKRGTSNFRDYINYAWESNQYSDSVRNRAEKIFRETDILVIIGYSFPTFNKEIDKKLFKKFYDRKDDNKPRLKIFFQDPNASEERIKEILNLDYSRDVTLKCIRDESSMSYFYLPYEF